MNTQKGVTAVGLLSIVWLILIGATFIGWVWNIIKIVHTGRARLFIDAEPSSH